MNGRSRALPDPPRPRDRTMSAPTRTYWLGFFFSFFSCRDYFCFLFFFNDTIFSPRLFLVFPPFFFQVQQAVGMSPVFFQRKLYRTTVRVNVLCTRYAYHAYSSTTIVFVLLGSVQAYLAG